MEIRKSYIKLRVLNSSVFMDEATDELMKLLDKGYKIMSIHENIDKTLTIYILRG